jgi:hypothetical protein
MTGHIKTNPSGEASLDRALRRLVAEIMEGLRHGYFDFSIGCQVVGQERRQLILRAGKSHRFLISKGECIASSPSRVIPTIGAPAEELDQPRDIVESTSARQAQTAAGLGLLVAHGERS